MIVEHGEGGSKAAAPVARDIIAEALRLDVRRTPAYTERPLMAEAAAPVAEGARLGHDPVQHA